MITAETRILGQLLSAFAEVMTQTPSSPGIRQNPSQLCGEELSATMN
jgi:hypothetical protein